MTTSNETPVKKPLKLSRPGKLELKKTVETGQVRQSFSHGRTKAVVVEVKRSKTFRPGAAGRMTEVVGGGDVEPVPQVVPEAPVELEPEVKKSRLSAKERESRMRALEQSKEDEALRQKEEEARRAEEAELRAQQEAEEAAQEAELERRRAAEEEARKILDAESPSAATERTRPETLEIATPPVESRVEPVPVDTRAADRGNIVSLEDDLGGRIKKKKEAPKPTTSRRGDERRRHGKLTIAQALEGSEDRQRSLAAIRRRREKQLRAQRDSLANQPPQKIVREVVVPETITVQELANRMAERTVDVIKSMMKMGVMATANQLVDHDSAELLIEEFGHKMKRVSAADVEIGLRAPEDEVETKLPRPPVVTVMGHVDHGKTSLLDALREADVASREAGGITQHIGAYQVTLGSGDRITFIDTPGHAAFTEMRSRGADVTDIVILVVAGDDGIKDQTVEAISHAKAAEVPIIVAINKMDRPSADANRVRQELLQHELVVEEMGGDILTVEVSAKEKTGLDKLEELILLQAEVLELTANPERSAEGVVIEAKVERGRGSVATVLVQRGTVKIGDIFVAGSEFGKVRALVNDRGESVEEAGPSVPVEVLGLNGTPMAGDEFIVVENEARAREVSEFRQRLKRDAEIAASSRTSLEQMLINIQQGETKEFPVVIKSDVQGSVEAIVQSLEKLGTEEVKAKVLHSGVGGINESDVTLANATGALIIAFNVRANPQAREMARSSGVEIRYYSIIYNVVDDIKAALSGMLDPTQREQFLGYAQIREIFNITKVGKVAGCMVTEGQVRRGAKVRLLRDNVVIHDGLLKTLRRFKDEVREVKEGYECGMAFENYHDIQINDQIECYIVEEVAREL